KPMPRRTTILFLASALICFAASALAQIKQESENSGSLACFVEIEATSGQTRSPSSSGRELPLLSPKTPSSISIRIKNKSSQIFEGPVTCFFQLEPADKPAPHFRYVSFVDIPARHPLKL